MFLALFLGLLSVGAAVGISLLLIDEAGED